MDCDSAVTYYVSYLILLPVTDITGNELERALKRIGREDVIRKCMTHIEEVTDDVEIAVAKTQLETDQEGKGRFLTERVL